MLKNFLKNKGKDLIESFKAPKGEQLDQKQDSHSFVPAQPTVDQKVTQKLFSLNISLYLFLKQT